MNIIEKYISTKPRLYEKEYNESVCDFPVKKCPECGVAYEIKKDRRASMGLIYIQNNYVHFSNIPLEIGDRCEHCKAKKDDRWIRIRRKTGADKAELVYIGRYRR